MVKTRIFQKRILGLNSGLSCLFHSGLWRGYKRRQQIAAYFVVQGTEVRKYAGNRQNMIVKN